MIIVNLKNKNKSHKAFHFYSKDLHFPNLSLIEAFHLEGQFHLVDTSGPRKVPHRPRQCVQYQNSTQPGSKNNHTRLKQNSLGLRKLNFIIYLRFYEKIIVKKWKKLNSNLLVPNNIFRLFFKIINKSWQVFFPKYMNNLLISFTRSTKCHFATLASLWPISGRRFNAAATPNLARVLSLRTIKKTFFNKIKSEKIAAWQIGQSDLTSPSPFSPDLDPQNF